MAPPPIGLLNHDILFLAPLHKQQQKRRCEEENHVHDAEGKTGLQHRARLVHAQMQPARAAQAARVQRDGEGTRAREVAAVRFGDRAQFDHARDQRARDAEVDEGHPEGGAARGFSPEERRDRPDGGEDGGYEENSRGGGVSCGVEG